MSKRTVTMYDSAFKERAVKLALESASHSQVARDLGIHRRTLYGWIRDYQQGEKARRNVNAEPIFDEVKRLRKENARLKEERDILKKAAAYFAVHSR